MPTHQLNAKQLINIQAIACVTSEKGSLLLSELHQQIGCKRCDSLHKLEQILLNETLLSLPDVLLLEVNDTNNCFGIIERIKANVMLSGLIVVVLSAVKNSQWASEARRLKIHDYYEEPLPVADICERLSFLIKFKLIRPTLSELLQKEEKESVIKIPFWKRSFDVVFAGTLLLLLSPLMATAAVLISIESKGPVVYRSKRVGTGYRIFYFYKFRSMYPDADKRLAELRIHNQYSDSDGGPSAFIKLKNDPRITKVGQFLRRTSIDELPQLYNILRGDMSAVGNRPLPLYEAEQLTSNEWSWRFLAPSGLTGLWQISRRGRAEMSDRERKKLDNFYAKKFSILLDLKILLKTIPAVFQKENV